MKKRSKLKDVKAKMLRKGPVKATRKSPNTGKANIGNQGGVRAKPHKRGGGLSKASQMMEKNDIPV